MKTVTRRKAIDPATIEAANRVLVLWRCERSHLELRAGRLWFVTRYGAKAVQLNRSCWPTFRYGSLGLSGTSAIALAQVVRWVRGQPRRPLRCWRYWCHYGLGGDDLIAALEREGYADPKATACVRCWRPDPTDWWDLDGVSGPCCQWGRCGANPANGVSS